MSPTVSALSGLRIGPVSYLNAKPLIWGLNSNLLQTDVPAALSEQFFAAKLDIALLPVVDILRAGAASIVDNVGIGCDGEVFSVVVASRTSFLETRKIHLDPASRSSTALLRVLLAEFYPEGPQIVEGEEIPDDGARLLIGDSAISFRRCKGSTWSLSRPGMALESSYRTSVCFCRLGGGQRCKCFGFRCAPRRQSRRARGAQRNRCPAIRSGLCLHLPDKAYPLRYRQRGEGGTATL